MNKIILAVALLLTVSGHVAGQTSYLSEIGIEKKLLYKTGDKMAALSFYFDITNLKLHAQHSLMLYPVLVSDDGSGEQAFPSVLINGSTRNKVAEREKRLDKKRRRLQDVSCICSREKKRETDSLYSECSFQKMDDRWRIAAEGADKGLCRM